MQNLIQKCCSVCSKSFPATREYFGHYSRNGKFKPNCRECERERVKAWRKKNPQKANAGYKRRQNKLDGWVPTAEQKIKLYLKADGICRYCQTPLGVNAQVDHAIPVARGGTNDISNLDLICARCNQEKDAKTPTEYDSWKRRAA